MRSMSGRMEICLDGLWKGIKGAIRRTLLSTPDSSSLVSQAWSLAFWQAQVTLFWMSGGMMRPMSGRMETCLDGRWKGIKGAIRGPMLPTPDSLSLVFHAWLLAFWQAQLHPVVTTLWYMALASCSSDEDQGMTVQHFQPHET